MWWRRYRLLVVVYGAGLVVGLREFVKLPDGPPPTWREEMTDVVAQLNPDDPDTRFYEGMRALSAGDEEEFVARLEEALAADPKHNEELYQYYTQHLLNRGGDWQAINEAAKLWRSNHPSSARTLTLRMGRGPTTPAEETDLRQALAKVPWVSAVDLETYEEDGVRRWRALLQFAPGQPVDIREAVAATSILALTPEQRALYELTCETLEECSVRPRVR